MGAFSDQVKLFATVTVPSRAQAVFVGAATEVKNSIQFGSPLTGSPGQPVDEGNLRASWQLEFESPTSALVSTNVAYAESNEDGIARPGGGPYVQRSAVGGRHSVQKTVDNFPRIVEAEVAKLGSA